MHAEAFNKMVRTRSVWYDNGNNLLIPWGGDFSFFLAFMPFDSMDKFIEYMNAHEDKYHIHMQYSTLSEYVQKVHQYKKKWTLKRDDFFPLADGPYGYWTGFYTTRDRLKGLIRYAPLSAGHGLVRR